MPKLILKFNAAVLKEYDVDKSAVTIGRKADNDIVINNPAVSSHHCKITKVGDEYFVEDLKSTNGTYLNNERIVKAGLKHNDVVGMATKHALVFVSKEPVAAQPTEKKTKPVAEPTVMLSPDKQDEMAKTAQASAGQGSAEQGGYIQVIKGIVDKDNHELTRLSTYIGKSDRVQIQIKGFFASAPEVAASIHRKPEGYILVAVKDGYPVVNGSKVSGQILLKDGDIIECGATTMQFFSTKPAGAAPS